MEKPNVVHRQRLKRRARRAMRRLLPFVASLFMATPLATPVGKTMANPTGVEMKMPTAKQMQESFFDQRMHDLYRNLNVEAQGLRYEVFAKAVTGYLNLKQDNKLGDKQLLTVVDFELPSTEKRLWVLDLAQKQVLFHTLVAHGHNSGENVATNFSNENESNMSSLGFYVTRDEYRGKHGRSLKLDGVDEGFNTNALERSVVMHGADYVSEDFIRQYGRLGRSLGCPALPMDQYEQIIDTVNGGTCLYLNGSNPEYSSKYLNEDVAMTAVLGSNQLI
ncbi:murein L,D-transpeptidase catalytic domain family protein [Hymenobacter jejuensis]|uniref:Murein L,D-transpeptidase catalytic domain family protein n=2 Tax=Hymenobacter jejuensis TaxID=2502781 RepID=A0A5B8A264_9BACT|nr:murein L,D-transpeptidase catalytic domain family protein [Hymenobacter jejuensis]